jgi:hypothetical protein
MGGWALGCGRVAFGGYIWSLMTSIVEKELVHAPLASADRLLQGFFAAHPAPDGAGARIVLRAGEAAQPAIVGITRAHRPGDMTPRYAIHWEAEGPGLYPNFDGELSVEADEDYNAFWFVLNGTYVPPGGVAGQLFDAAIGRRIADATARGLLGEMRVETEAIFAAQESTKRAAVREITT